MSLLVVIKGPVASAGSMPNLLRSNGIKVPNNEAIMITDMSDTEIISPILTS